MINTFYQILLIIPWSLCLGNVASLQITIEIGFIESNIKIQITLIPIFG